MSYIITSGDDFVLFCDENKINYHINNLLKTGDYSAIIIYQIHDENKDKKLFGWILEKNWETNEYYYMFSGNICIPPWKKNDAHYLFVYNTNREKLEKKNVGEKTENSVKIKQYDDAPDIGGIDSIEQFSVVFPLEDIENFEFIETGYHELIQKYGNQTTKYYKSGYDLPYFGINFIDSDYGFNQFPVKFYHFYRKKKENNVIYKTNDIDENDRENPNDIDENDDWEKNWGNNKQMIKENLSRYFDE